MKWILFYRSYSNLNHNWHFYEKSYYNIHRDPSVTGQESQASKNVKKKRQLNVAHGTRRGANLLSAPTVCPYSRACDEWGLCQCAVITEVSEHSCRERHMAAESESVLTHSDKQNWVGTQTGVLLVKLYNTMTLLRQNICSSPSTRKARETHTEK